MQARLRSAAAALERLDELAEEEWTRPRHGRPGAKAARVPPAALQRPARRRGDDSEGIEERSIAYQRLTRELGEAQRRAVVQMRNDGAISNEVMMRIERELDLEDSRLEI